jgi:hypothetical protein
MNSEKEGGGRYVVERSLNGIDNFTKVGEVVSKGPSQSPVSYSFTDNTYPVFEELIYYRIVYYLDGLFDYSPVKLVQRNPEQIGSTNWYVYPNPSDDGKICLKLLKGDFAPGEKVQIQALNGYTYLKTVDVVPGSEKEIYLDQILGPLPLGITILRVQWNGQSEVFKLIRTD